jgi:hypothetical protein
MKSTWHSPDGFVKIETFEDGRRILYHPVIGYPVTMPQDMEIFKAYQTRQEQLEETNYHDCLDSTGFMGQG